MLVIIDGQSAGFKNPRLSARLIRDPRPCVADRSADPREKLGCSERFRDVIVGSEIQCLHLIPLMGSRRHNDHRHRGPFPHALQDLHAVHIRKTEIQDHHVRTLGGHHAVCLRSRLRNDHIVIVRFQHCLDEIADPLVVFHDQHSVFNLHIPCPLLSAARTSLWHRLLFCFLLS